MVKKLLTILLLISMAPSISSCGAISSLIPRDLEGKYKEKWSFCAPSPSNQSYCEIYGEITNTSDSPVSISGCFYAVVGGNTYTAEETNSNTGCVSDTINPGGTYQTGADFILPRNQTIERIFIASSSNELTADFVMKVGRSTDPD